MVENRPFLNLLTHLVLIVGVLMVVFPVYLAFIASTHGPTDFMSGVVPLTPGSQFSANYGYLLNSGNPPPARRPSC